MPLFGELFYDPSKWRPSVPFVEQLKAFQELIDEGKVTTLIKITCYSGFIVMFTVLLNEMVGYIPYNYNSLHILCSDIG